MLNNILDELKLNALVITDPYNMRHVSREFDSLFSSNTSQSLYWLYFFVKIKFYLYTLHCVVV